MNIVEDRAGDYGDPNVNIRRTATLWSAYLGQPITAHDVAVCMILVKVSRLAVTPGHADTLVDISGYAEIARIVTEQAG